MTPIFLALEDAELRRQAAVGPAEQARLRDVFATHYDTVFRTLRRSGLSPAQADDGVQQVFLVAMHRLSDMQEGREKAFLWSTALNIARRIRAARPREVLRDELPEHEGGARPDELAEQRSERAVLDGLLARMDDDLREVLVLQEVEGLSKRETALVLGIPEGTVASRMRRARESFQALLKQHLEGRAP